MKVIFLILTLFVVFNVHADDQTEREKKQVEYDQACEQAREKELKPLREKYVEECVNNEGWTKDREQCENFYSDYGSATHSRHGVGSAMFYDLPECKQAFDYKESYRQ
jgi:type III secretory pathway component EscR